MVVQCFSPRRACQAANPSHAVAFKSVAIAFYGANGHSACAYVYFWHSCVFCMLIHVCAYVCVIGPSLLRYTLFSAFFHVLARSVCLPCQPPPHATACISAGRQRRRPPRSSELHGPQFPLLALPTLLSPRKTLTLCEEGHLPPSRPFPVPMFFLSLCPRQHRLFALPPAVLFSRTENLEDTHKATK